jgi:hypothetical protein
MTDRILNGFSGQQFIDTGYFYCPYIPLVRTPVVLDPDGNDRPVHNWAGIVETEVEWVKEGF